MWVLARSKDLKPYYLAEDLQSREPTWCLPSKCSESHEGVWGRIWLLSSGIWEHIWTPKIVPVFWKKRTCWLSPGKWNKKRLCYRELKKKVRKSPTYSRFPHLSKGAEKDLHGWHLACMHAKSLSHIWLFATLWTVAHQTPLSMRFSRQEYWSGLPCPSPGDLPDPGIKHASLTSPALAGKFFTTVPPGSLWHLRKEYREERKYGWDVDQRQDYGKT